MATDIEFSLIRHTPDTLIEYIKTQVFPFHVTSDAEKRRHVGQLILTETNEIKPFYKFFHSVKELYPDCNRKTLENEFVLFTNTARMAVKWEDFQKNGDRYPIKLSTEGKFAPLNGIVLPLNDPFWLQYFPPLGWWDLSSVVQVLPNKYPLSNSKQCIKLAASLVTPPFKFNPGLHPFPQEL